MTTERISATESAKLLIRKLTAEHGDIVFLQSGGCCEGSGPLCMPVAEMRPSAADVVLGVLEGATYYMSESHYSFAKDMHTILDAVPGSSGSFSLDCGTGFAFITKARVYTAEERASLNS